MNYLNFLSLDNNLNNSNDLKKRGFYIARDAFPLK